MLDVVLYQPEIPPNTGNIIRLCANAGCTLHLVKPLGFRMSSRALKRAGLDYGDVAKVQIHGDWDSCCAHFEERLRANRVFTFSTRALLRYDRARFGPGDVLVFGPETRGLPAAVLGAVPETCRLRIPMRPASRSLNLSNAVAVVVYEAWRQIEFAGAEA